MYFIVIKSFDWHSIFLAVTIYILTTVIIFVARRTGAVTPNVINISGQNQYCRDRERAEDELYLKLKTRSPIHFQSLEHTSLTLASLQEVITLMLEYTFPVLPRVFIRIISFPLSPSAIIIVILEGSAKKVGFIKHEIHYETQMGLKWLSISNTSTRYLLLINCRK